MSLHIKTGPAPDMDNISLKFPYEPDHFQKHSFQAIESGQHVLVTAHTGSGKTSVAEYATAYGIKKGKKVIYTSPIKALSMQIYGDFRRKYPEWDIGIKTGDIDERSEDAQVVIMTTEILRNILFNLNSGTAANFNIEQVSVVIFDEVHWIKDPDRGTVWEESIINMPNHIQMIMLSATLPDAIDFAQWIVKCKGRDLTYTTTPNRVVPLSHYVLTGRQKLLIMDNEYHFNQDNYNRACKEYSFSPDQLDEYIPRIDLPALFFCFSRRQCQKYAGSIKKALIDSKLGNQMLHEFENMLRVFSKSYQSMPETEELRSLLFKGIAYHHAGLPPPLKEIVQELFSQGWIKILFVTETFAAGVNMPAKTTVLCGLTKIGNIINGNNGNNPTFRTLLPEEYGQISGRAGRRGIDKKGTVILMPFNTKYGLPSLADARHMMCGEITRIVSRFRVDYSYILKNMLSDSNLLLDTANKSLLSSQEEVQYKNCLETRDKLLPKLNSLKEQLHVLDAGSSTVRDMYNTHTEYTKKSLSKAQLKNYHRTVKPWIEQHTSEFNAYKELKNRYLETEQEYRYIADLCEAHNERHIARIAEVIDLLIELGYVSDSTTIENCSAAQVTLSGTVAAHVNECNPIMLTELLMGDYLNDIVDFSQLASILSLFLQAKNSDREIIWPDECVRRTVRRYLDDMEEIDDFEARSQCIRSDWSYTLEYVDIAPMWVTGSDFHSIIYSTGSEIYSGEFVRMMLKLNNICRECTEISHIMGNDRILKILDGYQPKIIRDIVVPQSLYIQ